MTDEIQCFVTGKPILPADMEEARFTHEFDAWVSKEGQKILENEPEAKDDPELSIIIKEWSTEEQDWYEEWEKHQ